MADRQSLTGDNLLVADMAAVDEEEGLDQGLQEDADDLEVAQQASPGVAQPAGPAVEAEAELQPLAVGRGLMIKTVVQMHLIDCIFVLQPDAYLVKQHTPACE